MINGMDYLFDLALLPLICIAAVTVFKKTKGDSGNAQKTRIAGHVVAVISGSLIIWISLFRSIGNVGSGCVGVRLLFGKVDLTGYENEGLYLINPFYDIQEMSIRRRTVTRQVAAKEGKKGSYQFIAISKNGVRLTIDATFPFWLNPKYAAIVFRNIGNDEQYVEELIYPEIAKVLRDGVKDFNDSEAYAEKREFLAESLTKLFKQGIIKQLSQIEDFQKLSAEEISNVIYILPVQLRRVEPPGKILNATAEKIAAEEDLARQITLTQIAKEEAKRRKNEGIGITNFLAALPKTISAEKAVDLLRASADMTRAKALMKAVESDQVKFAYISGNSSIAVPAP